MPSFTLSIASCKSLASLLSIGRPHLATEHYWVRWVSRYTTANAVLLTLDVRSTRCHNVCASRVRIPNLSKLSASLLTLLPCDAAWFRSFLFCAAWATCTVSTTCKKCELDVKGHARCG